MDMADMCEYAHNKTVEECKEKNITVDLIEANGDVRYTEEAQDIFNKHYNYFEENYEKTNTRTCQ